MREVILCSQDDPFFRKIMHCNMGESAELIHGLVREFLDKKNSSAQMQSLEDMQRILDQFPEFKKSQRIATKHFNVL
jgi:vacuolar protein sorting-associated protein 45